MDSRYMWIYKDNENNKYKEIKIPPASKRGVFLMLIYP